MSRLLFRYDMSLNLQERDDKYNLTKSSLDFRKI